MVASAANDRIPLGGGPLDGMRADPRAFDSATGTAVLRWRPESAAEYFAKPPHLRSDVVEQHEYKLHDAGGARWVRRCG